MKITYNFKPGDWVEFPNGISLVAKKIRKDLIGIVIYKFWCGEEAYNLRLFTKSSKFIQGYLIEAKDMKLIDTPEFGKNFKIVPLADFELTLSTFDFDPINQLLDPVKGVIFEDYDRVSIKTLKKRINKISGLLDKC